MIPFKTGNVAKSALGWLQNYLVTLIIYHIPASNATFDWASFIVHSPSHNKIPINLHFVLQQVSIVIRSFSPNCKTMDSQIFAIVFNFYCHSPLSNNYTSDTFRDTVDGISYAIPKCLCQQNVWNSWLNRKSNVSCRMQRPQNKERQGWGKRGIPRYISPLPR